MKFGIVSPDLLCVTVKSNRLVGKYQLFLLLLKAKSSLTFCYVCVCFIQQTTGCC